MPACTSADYGTDYYFKNYSTAIYIESIDDFDKYPITLSTDKLTYTFYDGTNNATAFKNALLNWTEAVNQRSDISAGNGRTQNGKVHTILFLIEVDDLVLMGDDYVYSYTGSGGAVNIPATVKHINGDAFVNAKLTCLTMGSQVRTIGDNAFAGAVVDTVVYHGTKADREKLTIG